MLDGFCDRLRRTGLPDDLGAATDRPKRLGLYGFGGSAHLCAQLAIALGIEVHVLTRGEQSRRLAADLGAALRWEPSRGGALFPHLYGVLDVACVRAVTEAPLDADGVPQLGTLA